MTPTSDGLPSATSSCKITWLVLLTRSRLQGRKTYLRKEKEAKQNKPHFHLANELQRITRVDLTYRRRRCASSTPLVRERRLSRLDITAGEGAQKRTSG